MQDSLQLHPGDSLAISSRTTTFEAVASEGCRPDDWHLATLHLLFNAGLPDAVDGEGLATNLPSSPSRRIMKNQQVLCLRNDDSVDACCCGAGTAYAVQTALDSRLPAPSVNRVSSSTSEAISQRISVAPQPAAARSAELPHGGDGHSTNSQECSDSDGTNSDDGTGWLQRRLRLEQQLMRPVLQASEAIQRLLSEAWSWRRWRQDGIMQRKLSEVDAVQLPNQTNRLALAFSPLQSPSVSFCCGMEVFEPSHVTSPHKHDGAWELFFIISGVHCLHD